MNELSKAASILGKKGGQSGMGSVKARPSEVARRAAFFRWGTWEQRFWSKIQKGSDDECWPWIGSRLPQGYGQFCPRAKVHIFSHRMAWELAFGPIPKGMKVCHHCDNPPCCNPKHLFLGSQKDNLHDMIMKKRHWIFKGGKSFKLCKEDVRSIRRMWSTEMATVKDLAEKFHVSRRNISMIVSGHTWKHI